MSIQTTDLERVAPSGADLPVPAGGGLPSASPSQTGLTSKDAALRLEHFGPNKLPEPKPPGPIAIFVRQFLSPFIYILLIAAIVSLAIGQVPNAIFIAAVLILNALIGTIQEFSAQRSAQALRAMVKGVAHVLRDGEVSQIDTSEIVPGDVVLVASGDKIPADITLFESQDLTVDESMLTGESLAVLKDHKVRPAEDAPLAERANQLFAGGVVTRGRGRGRVDTTGLSTEIGSIAKRITDKRVSEPPLLIRVRRFTYQVAGVIILAIVALAALMSIRGDYTAAEMLMMGIGLAVSTIPEGLPAALTVGLAIGMQRMAQKNVIIRKLVAVEALGSCTFICSDKTGTLTVNELTIDKAVLPSGRTYATTGAGIAPGEVKGEDLERLKELITTGVLANESYLEYAGGDWVADGDIVDVAFLVFAKKFGMSLTKAREEYERRKLIPYESERAFSASYNNVGDDVVLFIKGSPEKVLDASSHMLVDHDEQPINRSLIESQFEELAKSGYRVIALARRNGVNADEEALEGLTFLGMVAMIDPVRPEAKEAVENCRQGGIAVAMVTGDHPATARSIGVDLGLCEPDDQVVTGVMLKAAQAEGHAAVRELVLPARIFARIEPAQKELIVQTFEEADHFVAVTGDGVNDAPALRRANAGVAMGKSGTDVAKEAADLIITDDNFASIVAGVEQGRIVYNNIRKVIALLTATGFSALVLFFLSVGAGLPMPMSAIQLLWLNLIANGLQDVALAFEPKEGDELTYPPRDPKEPIFERRVIEHVLVSGATMGVLAFAVFAVAMSTGMEHFSAQNITLMMMVLFGCLHALSSRSEHRSLFAMPYTSNRVLAIATPLALSLHLISMQIPGLRHVIGLEPIPFETFGMLLSVALTFLCVEELHKLHVRHQERKSVAKRA